jgi:hypothetical protein
MIRLIPVKDEARSDWVSIRIQGIETGNCDTHIDFWDSLTTVTGEAFSRMALIRPSGRSKLVQGAATFLDHDVANN